MARRGGYQGSFFEDEEDEVFELVGAGFSLFPFGFHWFGTRGMMDSTDWDKPTVTGKGTEDPERIKQDGPVEHVPITPHMQNWLQCLRTREQPNANVDAGYQHGVACILSDRAMVEGRRMIYDVEKREITAG